MKYDASMSWAERTVSALEGAFRSEVRARRVNGPHRDVIVSLDAQSSWFAGSRLVGPVR